MKFGAGIPGLNLFPGRGEVPRWCREISTEQIVAIARRADDLGYDYLSTPWHLVMRRGDWERNMGPRWPHSLSAAGFLLGATRRIKVKSLIVVPCQQPIELAKAIATLDWMSGGRLIPMLMTGYMDWEFELLGVPFRERGAIMDEYIAVMIELWTADEPAFDGKYLQFREIVFDPKPAQHPLPLWFGGRDKRALRRIARWGQGWDSYATAHAEMPATIAYIRSQPEFRANPRPLEISAYFVESTYDPVSHELLAPPRVIVGREAILSQLRYLALLGVASTGAPLGSKPGRDGTPEPINSVEAYLERLEWFASEIMPAARQLEAALPALEPA